MNDWAAKHFGVLECGMRHEDDAGRHPPPRTSRALAYNCAPRQAWRIASGGRIP